MKTIENNSRIQRSPGAGVIDGRRRIASRAFLVRCQSVGLLGLLVAASPGNAAVVTWNGGGANNLWSNSTNWVGGLAPSPGDDLTFPETSVQRANQNDYPAGTLFNSLTLLRTNNPAFSISGNAFLLAAGLVVINTIALDTISPAITLTAPQTFLVGSGTIFVNGALNNNGHTLTVTGGGVIYINGSISGAGGIAKLGGALLELTASNSFTGPVSISGGSIIVNHDNALGAVGAGTTVSNAALILDGGITVSEPLTLGGGASSATLTSIFGTNAWNGGIALAGSHFFATISVGSQPFTINGAMSGAGGGFTKSGNGLLVLNGNGTQTGTMRISGGPMLVNGSHPASPVELQSAGSVLLGGSGVVGPVTTLGLETISPGSSAGILSCSNLTLTATTTNHFELNSAIPGTGYDQLKVNGTVALDGAQLSLALNYTPANGTKFYIVTNQGALAVSGTFAGLPQGALLTNGATTMQISYTGGNGNDVLLTTGCVNPCNLVLHDGPTPYLVYVRWDAPLGPVDEYIIFRNGIEVQRYEASTFLSFPLFYDPFLQPSHSYTYQVVATFTNGAVSLPSNPLVVITPPATPVVGTNDVVSLLVRFADYVEEPYSTNFVDAVMFTNQYSVAAYYREASYDQYQLQGTSHGWFTLPGYGSNYCSFQLGNNLWYGPNMGLIRRDTLNVIPAALSNLVVAADVAQFIVHGLGTVGLSGGATKMYSSTNGFSVGTVLHEISHGLNNLGHAGGWHNLPGGYSAGPELLDLYSGGCSLSTYGDWYDPLGGGATVHHNTYFKEKLGWMPTNNIAWIDHDGDYKVWAIEQNTNQIQMLKFDLGNEMFYFFEYRTMTGFDGPSTPGPGLSSFDGVLGRLRLSFSQGGDIESVIPYPAPSGVPRIFNPGTPFLDPYRSLRVEVVSKAGGVATLRVSGLTNVFRLTNIRKVGGGGQDVELTFNSLQGAKYLTQATTNFTDWQTVKTNVLAPTNSTITVLTNAGTPLHRAFRVGVDATSP